MIVRDYFDGYRGSAPHPYTSSTGSEGRCDICGRRETRDHAPPWTRVAPQYVETPDPIDMPPLEPYTGGYGVLIDL